MATEVTRAAPEPVLLQVEFERESEGRWIADVVTLPGVMAYGATRDDALRAAVAFAFEVVADRMRHREDPLTGRPADPPPLVSCLEVVESPETDSARQAPLAR